MSEHWNPDAEIARWTSAGQAARPARRAWPEGATAGLLLVAVSCMALGAALYQFAGPRQLVEDHAARR